jgi:magnesium-transporting ATPase (P-type)
VDVFCTDKTGTLTEARIHLERHLDPLGRESQRVLELAYLNSFFETGLKSPLDDAILEQSSSMKNRKRENCTSGTVAIRLRMVSPILGSLLY